MNYNLRTSVDARETKLNYLYNKLIQNPDDPMNQLHLTEEIKRRQRVDRIFNQFKAESQHIDDKKEAFTNNYECLRQLVNQYDQSCGPFDADYDLKYVKYFVQECESISDPVDILNLKQRIIGICWGNVWRLFL